MGLIKSLQLQTYMIPFKTLSSLWIIIVLLDYLHIIHSLFPSIYPIKLHQWQTRSTLYREPEGKNECYFMGHFYASVIGLGYRGLSMRLAENH